MPIPNEKLRIGRDPNDTTWVMVRYPADFASAHSAGVSLDPGRGVLELSPITGAVDGEAEWLAKSEALRTNTKTRFFLDRRGWLYGQKPCDLKPVRLTGVGADLFCRPIGLVADTRGYLFVADRGNHRVVVLALDATERSARFVFALGAVDSWGQPVEGIDGGAMTEPVHLVLSPCFSRVYVADREGGRIHVFDQTFSHVQSFVPLPVGGRSDGLTPRPAAICVKEDGTLVIVDGTWPRLLRTSRTGEALPAEDLQECDEAFASLRLRRRFETSGQIVLGPLDAGQVDATWHRIALGATLPKDTSVTVQTFASNDATTSIDAISWGPANPQPITQEDETNGDGEVSRLVLSDTTRWQQEQAGPHRRSYPTLARYSGTGPVSAATANVPARQLAKVRVGDTVRFTAVGAAHEATVTSIPDASVTVTVVSGATKAYGAGSELFITEREGSLVANEPRRLHQLGVGEAVDLSSAPLTGHSITVACPHSIAALLVRGDEVMLVDGGDSIRLAIDAIHLVDGNISFAPSVPGDFSSSELSLQTTPGRLFVEPFSVFSSGIARQSKVQVRNLAAQVDEAMAFWADGNSQCLWLLPGSLGPIVNFANWHEFEVAGEATDRGQYLWLRLVLTGAQTSPGLGYATNTPTVQWLRALWPRPSLLSLLPRIYGRREPTEDPAGALFLERFLSLFEGHFTKAEEAFESVSRLLNPAAADADWLRFVGCWLGVVFDPSWPIERRRALIVEADALWRRRGTLWSIKRYIEIYLGKEPAILEGFAATPGQPFVVGHTSTLGCFALQSSSGNLNRQRHEYAHRFTVFVQVDDACALETAESTLRSIIDSVKPAHTDYRLCLRTGGFFVGSASRVGLHTTLDDGSVSPRILGRDTTVNTNAVLTHPAGDLSVHFGDGFTLR